MLRDTVNWICAAITVSVMLALLLIPLGLIVIDSFHAGGLE